MATIVTIARSAHVSGERIDRSRDLADARPEPRPGHGELRARRARDPQLDLVVQPRAPARRTGLPTSDRVRGHPSRPDPAALWAARGRPASLLGGAGRPPPIHEKLVTNPH